MVRSVTVVLILTAVACVSAAPGQRVGRDTYSATASDGSLGIAYLNGGTFGPGSFSVGRGGNSYGSGDGGHGGNIGNKNYGGSRDTGRITYGSQG